MNREVIERYLNDPTFHNVVTAIAKMMHQTHYKPSIMQDALDMAVDIYVDDIREEAR